MTLAVAPEASSGRLERQSASGAVAVRELTAADCRDVAEGLALSLVLALQPRSGVQTPPASVPVVQPGNADENAWGLGMGAQGSVETGLAGAVLPGLALFGELRSPSQLWGVRVSARAAMGWSDTADPTGERADVGLDLALFAARAEGCLGAFRGSSLALEPCLGFDFGAVRADSASAAGQADYGQWASGIGHLRGGWRVSDGLTLEAQFGAAIPLVRYEIRSERGVSLASTDAVGLQAAIGATLAL